MITELENQIKELRAARHNLRETFDKQDVELCNKITDLKMILEEETLKKYRNIIKEGHYYKFIYEDRIKIFYEVLDVREKGFIAHRIYKAYNNKELSEYQYTKDDFPIYFALEYSIGCTGVNPRDLKEISKSEFISEIIC